MINPRFLNDLEVYSLIKETVRIIGVIRKVYKGKILLVGPFFRYLTPCCLVPSHQITPSKLFTSPKYYILCINQYLALHPALRLQNLEFITCNQIFGSKFPGTFLKDQVHLSTTAINVFVSFLSQVMARKRVIKPEISSGMTFYEWVDKKVTTIPSNLLPKPMASIAPVPVLIQASAAIVPETAAPRIHIVDEVENPDMDIDNISNVPSDFDYTEALRDLDVATEDEENL